MPKDEALDELQAALLEAMADTSTTRVIAESSPEWAPAWREGDPCDVCDRPAKVGTLIGITEADLERAGFPSVSCPHGHVGGGVLLNNQVCDGCLRRLQHRREWPVEVIHRLVGMDNDADFALEEAR